MKLSDVWPTLFLIISVVIGAILDDISRVIF